MKRWQLLILYKAGSRKIKIWNWSFVPFYSFDSKKNHDPLEGGSNRTEYLSYIKYCVNRLYKIVEIDIHGKSQWGLIGWGAMKSSQWYDPQHNKWCYQSSDTADHVSRPTWRVQKRSSLSCYVGMLCLALSPVCDPIQCRYLPIVRVPSKRIKPYAVFRVSHAHSIVSCWTTEKVIFHVYSWNKQRAALIYRCPFPSTHYYRKWLSLQSLYIPCTWTKQNNSLLLYRQQLN